MTTLKDEFKLEIAYLVEKACQDFCAKHGLAPVTLSDTAAQLTTPPSFELGQAALPCFGFAKSMRQAPPKIAMAFAEFINTASKTFVSKVDAVNGYLNFTCAFEKFSENLVGGVRTGSYFKCDRLASDQVEKIIVEYMQPNTHKALHVGHLRCLVLGDTVCNLLSYIGHDIVRATYPGDMGANTAKTLWYMKYRSKETEPVTRKADWLGEMYAKADKVLEAERGTPAEATNRDQLREILGSFDNETSDDYKRWKVTRDWCFDEMNDVYKWLGVKFDAWYTESECNKPAKALVKQLHAQGKLVEDQGAIGINLGEKLGFALYLKSDGNSLYLTKDLELMRRKFSDPKVTRSIYVVDARQKLHFQQLFKTGELLGYPQAAKSVHLPYETVNTEAGAAFSSRSLNGLKLFELRQTMEAHVTKEYLERYRGQWSDEEIRKTAEAVTIGALKFGMIRVDNNTPITFKLDEWLKLDGDTGPYLQYVHARCKNILEKQGKPQTMFTAELVDPVEKELSFWLGRFNEFAYNAANQYRPSVMASYLYDLAKAFNRFYEACPIKTATGNLRETRLQLVDTTATVLAKGLELLGIPAPNRM